jgi:hypothetical protein
LRITGPACDRARGTQSDIAAPAPPATKARRVDIGLSPAGDRVAKHSNRYQVRPSRKSCGRRERIMLHRATLLGPDKLL